MTSPARVPSPTVRRRRLALALRRLRAQSGLTADQVAKEVGISKSALSRIENAQVSVLPPVARALLEVYGVESPDIDALVQVARESRRRGWWQAFDDVLPEWFQVYVGLEAGAAEIRYYENQLVPGLFQTEAYATAVIRAGRIDDTDEEIRRRVELRMRRQRPDASARLWLVLDEAVIRRPVGGRDVMAEQLAKLAEVAQRPGTTIQVLPFSAGEHASLGTSFSILTFAEPADPGIVYVETGAGGLYLDDPKVRKFGTVFQHLVAAALGQRDSIAMIEEAAH